MTSPEPRSPREAGAQRILVVDDNEDGAEMLATMLAMGGYEVRTAHDGAGALEAARGFRPALVFLDIGLPGMSGYDVARAVRSDASLAGTKLVAVTGWGGEEAKQQAREAGFDLHLTKPVDPSRVAELVRATLG